MSKNAEETIIQLERTCNKYLMDYDRFTSYRNQTTLDMAIACLKAAIRIRQIKLKEDYCEL